MRRFEKHHRALLFGERCERLASIAGFAGQKPLECEAVGRQPRNGERCEHRRWSGNDGHVNTGGDRGSDEQEAWVTNGWHSGVAHHQDVRGLGQFNQLNQALSLVVLVQAKQLGFVAHA